MKPVFGPDLYKNIIREYGYEDSFFEGFTKSIDNFTASDLQRVFLCHTGLYEFDKAPYNQKVITTGLGLSGVPHIGTLSQIYRLSLLKKSGYNVQLVLGDLDAYNGKNVSMKRVDELAAKYENFIQRTGLLDASETTIVRRQKDAFNVLRTSYLLGRFVDDTDFENANEHIHSFYVDNGKVDEDMSYRRKLSLMLMLADFFDIGQKYPNVLVMLGVDEHQYVRVGQGLSKKVDEKESGLTPVHIASIYTPIINGLDGYPKMSKSFPGSSIDLAMDPEAIRSKITEQKPSELGVLHDTVFQMICAIGLGEPIELSEVEKAFSNPAEWDVMKEKLANHIIHYAEAWQQ
ncbi:MAG: hypothetical protein WAQ27_04785 [Candidatus Microsaccharimonas sp.]